MPRRDDLETILLIGSGPIVIGQACEFDYSGTQACRVLREEGYRVVLVNSNPATIMTDPEFADATYVEPLDVDVARRASSSASGPTRCCRRSAARPALNLAIELARGAACSTQYGVELIGANVEAIRTAEDRAAVQGRDDRRSASRCRRRASPTRSTRRCAVGERGRLPADHAARRSSSAAAAPASPHDADELRARRRATASPPARSRRSSSSESIAGWKEYELEVMRDHADNVRRHLLDREPRPDGRAHRRLDHGRAGADAHRRRVPAHARRRVRVHPPHRRRDRRLERAVRGRTPPTATWSSSR